MKEISFEWKSKIPGQVGSPSAEEAVTCYLGDYVKFLTSTASAARWPTAVRVPALLGTRHVTLSKLLNLSVPQFPPLSNVDTNILHHLIGLL